MSVGPEETIRYIHNQTGFPFRRIRQMYEHIFDFYVQELAAGESLRTPLGTFHVRSQIDAGNNYGKYKVKYKTSKRMLEELNGGDSDDNPLR